jgi:hypothetical protein
MQPEKKGSNFLKVAPQRFSLANYKQNLATEKLASHIAFVLELAVSRNPNELKKRLIIALKYFGFSDVAFMRHPLNQSFNFFLNSLPKELITSYQDRRFYEFDMALDYLRTGCTNNLYLSEIQQTISKASFLNHTFIQNLDILGLYRRFEFNDAYLIPITHYKKNNRQI